MVKKIRTNQRYTIEEIKNKTQELNPDIVILSNDYKNNKQLLECHCLVCDEPFKQSWNSINTHNRGCPACGKNGVKISKQEICDLAAIEGYEVVEFTGIDSNKGTTFLIKCSKGHTYPTSYREFNREEFRNGGSCKACYQNGYGRKRRIRIEEVLTTLDEYGYITEDFNYTDSSSVHRFVCVDGGHIRSISYNTFTSAPYCPQCKGWMPKHTDKSVSKLLSKIGNEYAEGYVNSSTPFRFKCLCGNLTEGRLNDILNGFNQCDECSPLMRWTLDRVKKYYEELNCTLLENEYINSKTNMKFLCRCGRKGFKSLNDFQKQPRCRECGVEARSGENHHDWNPNLTDEDRLKNRKYPEYQQWRLAVYERDNYTCQCCGDNTGGNLNAHHLDGHDWAIDLRLDINNGIALCEDCHIAYHNAYGYRNSRREDFEEYMSDLYELQVT